MAVVEVHHIGAAEVREAGTTGPVALAGPGAVVVEVIIAAARVARGDQGSLLYTNIADPYRMVISRSAMRRWHQWDE